MAQSLNLDATFYFFYARFWNKSLAMPHFSVKDINYINPFVLKELGFKGLVFDKDNTLTAPYVNEIFHSIQDSFENFKHCFGDDLVIMSNSAGTRDDKNSEDAIQIEKDLGIKVLRHDRKKPAGIEAVLDHFKGVDPKDLVMFGDRVFTDIVFGNRYGMLTVHTALLSEENDNKAAAKVRKYELPKIQKWDSKGFKPPYHKNYNPAICFDEL